MDAVTGVRRALLLATAVVVLPHFDAGLTAQTSSAGTATLTGTVLDTAQLPIPGAVVELLGLRQTRTDSGGAFRFDAVPAGSVILHVARIGLQPVMRVVGLVAGDSVDLDVTLRPAAYQLPTVIVREDSSSSTRLDLTGFERRRRNGMGHYLTADQIAQRHFAQTSQLLRTVPGLSINDRGIVTIQRGVNTIIGPQCETVVVLVDGVAIPGEKNAFNKETGFDVNTIPAAFIKGIEARLRLGHRPLSSFGRHGPSAARSRSGPTDSSAISHQLTADSGRRTCLLTASPQLFI